MRFRIRFADKIVGAFVIFALVVLVAVVALLGKSQRWFSRDPRYRAFFDSATGMAVNMDVQHRGFSIGRVKSFRLTEEDQVEVIFVIFENYAGRVTEGSLVELQASPIGLGNRFMFYPGLGTSRLDELALVPRRGSREAKDLGARGLTSIPEGGDDISVLLTRAGAVLERLSSVSLQLDEALAGTDQTAIGRILGGIEGAAAELPAVARNAGSLIDGLDPVLADLRTLSAALAAPDGTVRRLLDGEGTLNQGIESALGSVTGILRSLERTAEFIPAQLPQIGALIAEVRTVLHSVEGLLVSLQNNPILRKGFPVEAGTRTGGTSARNVDF